MAKPQLGSKQKCQNCGTKFFDLSKNPAVCPKCGTSQASVGPLATARASAREAPASDDEEPETENGTEILSLDDADQVENGKVAAASPGDEGDVEEEAATDDDDTFLEEEEDDNGSVSDLIDGDLEDDEER